MVECRINNEIFLYPTQRACERAGGETPETPTPIGSEDSFIPITYPPSQIRLSDAYSLVTTYVKAEEFVDSDPDAYIRAERELLDYALGLFAAARLEENPDQSTMDAWQIFVKLLNHASIENNYINILIELNQPGLMLADVRLLYDYVFGQGPIDYLQIQQRTWYHWRERLMEFPIDTADSAHASFISTMEIILGNDYEPFLMDAVRINATRDSFSRTLSNTQLFDELMTVQSQVELYPVGSTGNRQSMTRLRNLQIEILARGLSLDDYFSWLSNQAIPGLSEGDILLLQELTGAAYTYEGTDNNRLRGRFISAYIEFYDRYICEDSGSSEKNSLAVAIGSLSGLAYRFGITQRELHRLAAGEVGEIPTEFGSVPDMDALLGAIPITVSSEGLPQEVIQVLEETGYYALIRDNLREIVLTDEIDEGISLVLPDRGGEATPCLGLVTVDVFREAGGLLPVWQIAAVLVHEAAHVAWVKNMPGPRFLLPVPNEGNAFFVEARFLEDFLQRGLEQGTIIPDSELANEIMALIREDRAVVAVADSILGVAPGDREESLIYDIAEGVTDRELEFYPANIIRQGE
jgi:hypothetical protein